MQRVPVRMRGHMESMPMIGCLAFPMRMFPREGWSRHGMLCLFHGDGGVCVLAVCCEWQGSPAIMCCVCACVCVFVCLCVSVSVCLGVCVFANREGSHVTAVVICP